MKSRTLLLALLAAACGSGNDQIQPASAEAATTSEMSAEERTATEVMRTISERYADATTALADGFLRDPSGHCVVAQDVGAPAELGAMGVHYIHPARLGLVMGSAPVDGTDGIIDWAEPDVLVYEPQEDGSEKLVAVEYLVFRQAWEAAGNTAPPSFFGTPFVSMEDDPNTAADEAHGFMPHYELHVWTARENANGRFAEFNPAVSCAHAH